MQAKNNFFKLLLIFTTLTIMVSCETNNPSDNNVIGKNIPQKIPSRNELPLQSISSTKSINEIKLCIKNQLDNVFKLPKNYYQIIDYQNSDVTIALHNADTNKNGLLFDIIKKGNDNQINLYGNGSKVVSKAWIRTINNCK